MLIVSKFKDYYDTASMYGIDKTIVYSRTNSEQGYNYEKRHGREAVKYNTDYVKPDAITRHRWSKIGPYESIEASVIGFCGKFYPFYKFTTEEYEHHNSYVKKKISQIVYDKEQVIDILKEHNIYQDDNWRMSSDLRNKNYIEKFFDSNSWKYLEPVFIEEKQPVFLLKDTKAIGTRVVLELAPNLSDCKFGRCFSAPMAFQEIQNYISGVIGVGQREMVEISNEDQIHKKGYDKWSFRTHKEDSKKPRKKK